MTTAQHVRRLGLLMVAASALLAWLAVHTDVFFADGLRYIAQAKAIDHGSWTQGLVRSLDHPIYPMAIAAVHRLLGGNDPHGWQTAAQGAAAISGVLLVIPIYLVSLEVFGPASAWLACFLIFLLPFNGHVLADALSESTFLLFWTWGLWSSLRFLRSGGLGWLPLLIAFSVLAYLTRPEGLILPVALLVTLILLSCFYSDEIPRTKRWWAIGMLVAGTDSRGGPIHGHEGRYQYQAVNPADPGPRARCPGDGRRARTAARPRPDDNQDDPAGDPWHDTVGRGGDEPTAPLACASGYHGKLGIAAGSKILAASRHDYRALRPGHDSSARDVRLLHAPPCHGCRLDLDSGQRGRAQSAGRRTGPGD